MDQYNAKLDALLTMCSHVAAKTLSPKQYSAMVEQCNAIMDTGEQEKRQKGRSKKGASNAG